jgi:hypothetical protein
LGALVTEREKEGEGRRCCSGALVTERENEREGRRVTV